MCIAPPLKFSLVRVRSTKMASILRNTLRQYFDIKKNHYIFFACVTYKSSRKLAPTFRVQQYGPNLENLILKIKATSHPSDLFDENRESVSKNYS